MNSEKTESVPVTEQENPATRNLSFQTAQEIVRLINEQDALVAPAVRLVLPEVSRAVEGIVGRLKDGGRLFYIGTGTSGRLGVLDASECPPTFGVSPELVQGVIAGGYDACHRAVEASEDDANAGGEDLKARGFTSKDVLVGIAASGRTPYTVGAVKYARSLGALTVALTCVPDSPITSAAEISIVPVVGPEVIAGSTRMKAGTAQKLVLNMLSTASLAKLGYVTGNRMTSVQARNTKLRARAVRILSAETGLDSDGATAALDAAEGDIRVALVMSKTKRNASEAKDALAASHGVVQTAIDALRKPGTDN
ncbi:MAG TPA: N-acetylmuramic acid 6-phosphate etherase [Pyrinomonadaceae bacterium]|nr:N-acetylmuramic acid 6-phosphate etherase [Pyrinomonadaceae bacterium]